MKFKVCLEFEQNVVKKLSSFVKLVSPFRTAFLVKFVVSQICLLRVPWLHGYG